MAAVTLGAAVAVVVAMWSGPNRADEVRALPADVLAAAAADKLKGLREGASDAVDGASDGKAYGERRSRPMANGPASVPFPAMCPECEADPEGVCPRNIDGRCLECGAELCAAHLAEHFRTVHCMALTPDHAKAEA